MTPPTAPERCPTCDREECAVAAAAALVASLTIPVTPGENGCACYGEFSRSHNPSRGCEIHGTDGSVALEAAWSAERAAREDCHAHRKDWHAEAIANRTAAAQWAKVAPLIERLREGRTFAGRLRPCPFCGNEAEFEREGTRRQSCIVRCTNCSGSHEGGDEGTRSGASRNRRAGDELIDALLAATEATP